MQRVWITLIILVLFVVGIVALQIFLSGKRNKWLGLFMPIISFLLTLVIPLNMVAPAEGITSEYLLSMLLVLIVANIPTVFLSLIYIACREKYRVKSYAQ